MESIFLKILEMSIAGTVCILIVLALRILLRKMPKSFSYVLWLVVFLRLLCPFSLQSSYFGLELEEMGWMLESAAYEQELVEYQVLIHKDGKVETLISHGRQGTLVQATETPQEGTYLSYTERDSMPGGYSPAQAEQLPAQNNIIGTRYSHKAVLRQEREWVSAGSMIWAAGVAVLLGYSLVSYALLRRRLRQAVRIQEDVYESDRISTPFLLGFLDSRIYLPMGLGPEEKAHVLAHELVHLKRGDYLVKMVTWLTLSLHWFNPLVWLAYSLMVRDMEMSCDESVIRRLGKESKKAYSQTLLAISGASAGSSGRKLLPKAPLSFGEEDIRSRVKNILAYRSVKVGTGVLLVLLLAAAGVVLMTDRQASSPLPEGGEAGKLQGSAEQIPDEPETDTSDEGGEQSASDESERKISQLETLRKMDRGSGMTWEQLQLLAEETWPQLEDYAGYEGAVWPDEEELVREDGFLTLHLTYSLYDPDMDQNYSLYVQFSKKDLTLDSVSLYRESDGDVLVIYREPEGKGTYRNAEIAAFRQDIKQLGDWVSAWDMPHEEQVQMGAYQADVLDGGVLFGWKDESRDLSEAWAPDEWKSAGGFARLTNDRRDGETFAFDNKGRLVDLDLHMNHTSINGNSEVVEGCQEQAVLVSMNHDLYTVSQLDELEEAGRPVPEEESTVDIWYIGFAREDAPYGYVLFLAQRYYTREEAIAMARSIRFTEEAWAAE